MTPAGRRDIDRRRPRRHAIMLATCLAITGAVGAGCGEAGTKGRTGAAQVTVTLARRPSSRTPTVHRASPHPASPRSGSHGPASSRSVVARIDASSDAVLAEGKLHIASGAPSDAQVRKEIEAARKAGVVLPSGESAESFENAPSNSGRAGVQAEVPEAPWNPRSKPIATWIVPILSWAHEHGWRGTVTSGYRTYYEQAQLNAAGAFSAPAGLSNHETTIYPGGAVDVTNPSQLISVLSAYPDEPKLIGGVLGPVDPEHFSATGD
jgi:hypothetical protein